LQKTASFGADFRSNARVFEGAVAGVQVANGVAVRITLARLASVLALAATVIGCQPMPSARGTRMQTLGAHRNTSFIPAPNVDGSRLVTDRVVKLMAADEEAISKLGGVKLGVLHVRVVDRVDPMSMPGAWADTVVWPGASVDAAALGATHARKVTTAPPPPPLDCVRSRNVPCQTLPMTATVTASYELWHVAPERWAELPENLRPNALPASAIRDVQPGNWVRPPPVVTVQNE
jgi:hypothetical protein